jgi:hypothetical protein
MQGFPLRSVSGHCWADATVPEWAIANKVNARITRIFVHPCNIIHTIIEALIGACNYECIAEKTIRFQRIPEA